MLLLFTVLLSLELGLESDGYQTQVLRGGDCIIDI